jgi:hypothetical protein
VLGDKALSLTQRAKYIKVIGEMIRLMVLESTFILMEQSTKESGAKICSMGKE